MKTEGLVFVPSAMLDPRLLVCSREKTVEPQGKYREITETRTRGWGVGGTKHQQCHVEYLYKDNIFCSH